ncbi:protein translocase subunit SecF [Thiobaca trueperi]|uniref:Protein-export membrane protein SecF n=1 Tax=Thiobaca trueperi TaxID=127458 RepID=A0A4R3MT45_9GAMM|nr:protein translocase subunit SecF [Thiobaca trueperi]TCT19578.1 protein translocase subunit secF [Thiobaca trueperi]
MRVIKLPHFNFLSQRRKAMVFSAVLMVVSLLSLAVQGLNLGLDFTGGTLIEISYKESADLGEVRAALTQGGFVNVMVQQFGTPRDVLLRIPPEGDVNDNELSQRVLKALNAAAPDQVELRRVEFVGPQVGKELADQSGLAVLFSLIGILFYVALRFEWRFSVGAVAATMHDAIVVMGVFSVFRLDFDLTVLAAVLTVIGYSLNDTIVVFDRVRENFRKMRKGAVVEIMDQSVNETMSRTIITAGTVLLVVVALYLFGGATLQGFSLALIIGVVFGTYSTIYVATAAAVVLGVSRADLLKVPKEGAGADSLP